MAVEKRPSAVAQRIRQVRLEGGLSARELARLAGMGEAHVSLIESGTVGDIQVTTCAAIARVLGVSIDWLVTGEGRRPRRSAIAAAVDVARSAAAAA